MRLLLFRDVKIPNRVRYTGRVGNRHKRGERTQIWETDQVYRQIQKHKYRHTHIERGGGR